MSNMNIIATIPFKVKLPHNEVIEVVKCYFNSDRKRNGIPVTSITFTHVGKAYNCVWESVEGIRPEVLIANYNGTTV